MSNASDYADSLAADIERMSDAGAPFGLIDHSSDEWSNDEADYADWENSEETRWTEASAMDYLADVLDIQYVVGRDRQYRASRVLVAFGGPNAWIDTRAGQLEVTWWSAPEVRALPSGFLRGLDEALGELWEMGA